MLENKKILFLGALIFLSGMFILSSEKTNASCGDGGACLCSSDYTSATTCSDSTMEKIDFTASDCSSLASAAGVKTSNCICCKASSSSASSTKTTIEFKNPLNYTSVEGLLSAVMQGFQGIVVLFAMIFFIWGAVGYTMSAGDQTKMEAAKKGMIAALIGLALGIAAPSLLKTIGMILGWGTTDACKGITDETALKTCQDTFNNAPTMATIATRVLEFLLGIVGILGMIMIVIGGIMYFTAGANEKSVETAKNIVKYAVIGLALALASLVIVGQVAKLLV